MPENVKLPDSKYDDLAVGDYVERLVTPWDGRTKVHMRGSRFGEYTNPMSTADARAIFEYGLALCEEIDNPPRTWVTGAYYLSDRFNVPIVWRRATGGWTRVDGGYFTSDEDVATNTDWLDSLVRLVPANAA